MQHLVVKFGSFTKSRRPSSYDDEDDCDDDIDDNVDEDYEQPVSLSVVSVFLRRVLQLDAMHC